MLLTQRHLVPSLVKVTEQSQARFKALPFEVQNVKPAFAPWSLYLQYKLTLRLPLALTNMGVKHLWDILENCKKTVPLHHLQ